MDHRELVEHFGIVFAQVEALYHYMRSFPLAQAARAGLDTPSPIGMDREPRNPTERFLAAWCANSLPYPYQACTSEQLYRAFLRDWVSGRGGRSPPSQQSFTRTAVQWVNSGSESGLTYKIVSLADREGGSRKAARCWVPQDHQAPAGLSEGESVADQVAAFEVVLARPLVLGGAA